ncbi:cysteine export CydDC family ABC transporter permease subunit/ATP-binding protein CydD [Actinobacteria bacterium IMCC26207]|nr:cysteine export CydDC family ABC transporter permease subunit/ATP-binding protein CydD [Actinobacteria bacterium IMCC26207]
MWPRSLLAEHPQVRRWVGISILLGLFAAGILVAWTILLAGVINDGFIKEQTLSGVLPTLVLMAALLLLRAVCIWLAENSSQHASGLLRRKVRSDSLAHLIAVGPAGLSAERTAELTSTLGQGVDSLDAYLSRFLPSAALAVIVPAGVFVTIGILDPWTTLILLFTGPMLILLLAVIGSRTRSLTQRRFEELGWLSSFYLDMIQGLATLKAFGRADEGAEMVEQVSRRYGEATMDVLRTAFQTSLMMEWAATAATALVAVQISFRLIRGDLSFDLALAVLMLTPEFFAPLRRLAIEYHAGQEGNAALERITELNALPPQTRSVTTEGQGMRSSLELSSLGFSSLELSSVGFTYGGSDSPALEQVSFVIEQGQTVALIGPSGAGKSTLAKLLMQFMQPDQGQILINGQPAQNLQPSDWRRIISWVPQQPAFFAGTVAQNIALGRPDASIEQIHEAARVASAQGFIEALPEGFNTLLGENGLRLSGGQRQRLAIARAAIMNTPVVLLDEFTAHLDEDTEAQVVAAMSALMQGRTAVVIAHRAATIASAQRVITLDRGRVIQGQQ